MIIIIINFTIIIYNYYLLLELVALDSVVLQINLHAKVTDKAIHTSQKKSVAHYHVIFTFYCLDNI